MNGAKDKKTRRIIDDGPALLLPWLEAFIAGLEQQERSPHTLAAYRRDLTAFARWFTGTTGEPSQPDLWTATDLRAYRRHLVEDRSQKPSSVNRALAALKSYLRHAQVEGLVLGALPSHVPPPVAQVPLGPRWLDQREQRALLRAVERGGRARDVAIVVLLLHTGLRVAELCALTWQDVEIRERSGVLHVRRGKGRKLRSVPLNLEAREALAGLGFAEHRDSPEPIFRGQRGPLTPRGAQSALSRYLPHLASRGIRQLSPHLLRHTCLKNLRDAGASLEEVAAIAGHENLNTTRRYSEPSLKDLERAVGRLASDREG